MKNTIKEEHYDKNALKGIFYLKGYDGYIKKASDILCCSEKTTADKISRGCLSHEETIDICKALELTPRQYIQVFMHGVFDISEE